MITALEEWILHEDVQAVPLRFVLIKPVWFQTFWTTSLTRKLRSTDANSLPYPTSAHQASWLHFGPWLRFGHTPCEIVAEALAANSVSTS